MKILLTKQEAAYSLGVSERQVDVLRKAGDLNAVYMNRDVRFPVEEVKRYAEALPTTPPR